VRTWRQIHATFDRFRLRYYLDAEAPLMVPPRASELRWAWCRDVRVWGKTHFDVEDGEPHLVELAPQIRNSPSLAGWTLLHELSHMRNPMAQCSHRDRWWREEVKRLATLGAFTRESVF
jgi:hypothetical protein